MKKNLKLVAVAMLSFAMFVSCNDNGNDNGGNIGGDGTSDEIPATITSNYTLESGKTYKLDVGVRVSNGATLKIEAGVTIIAQYSDNEDYILIEQGAKIDAQGTKENPIVMTSTREEAGSWGGIHICGYAEINGTAETKKSEIGDATYGGSNNADNSGILRYIVLKYTGEKITTEKESNGISFYGVGSGTTVEYCHVYRGADDGFEFFGGSVNVKYLISTSAGDDSFDWTGGWSGKAQFLVAYQESETVLGYFCDKMIEADNDKSNYVTTPISNPIVANVTLVSENYDATEGNDKGVYVRNGTKIQLYNAIITGKAKDIQVTDKTEDTNVETYLKNGDSVLDYVYITSELSSKNNIYTNADFVANTNNKTTYTPSFTKKYFGIVAGGKDMKTVDSWFTTANYKGAIDPANDWTVGLLVD